MQGQFTALAASELNMQPQEVQDQADVIRARETQGALAKMAMFSTFMLACHIGLILYFKSKGGYKQKVIGVDAH